MAQLSDLIQDSKLETKFLPGETVHTYHEPDPTSGQRLVSRSEHWQRQREIGGGGFGTVWLEKCTKGGNRDIEVRAIKEIKIARQINYYRELEAIAKFSHRKVWFHQLIPLIVRFVDTMKYERCFVKSFGWYEGPERPRPEHLFIAMEYLELGDLKMYLNKNPALPEHEAREITFQILDGLSLMHGNRFTHRDLKPNVRLFFAPVTLLRVSFLILRFEF
jgi:serine/threonine protein kinase